MADTWHAFGVHRLVILFLGVNKSYETLKSLANYDSLALTIFFYYSIYVIDLGSAHGTFVAND